MSYIVKLEANWTALLALIKAEIELKPRNKYSELLQFWQSAQCECVQNCQNCSQKAPFVLPNHSYMRTGIKL